jgi:hypothetical protein
VEEVKEVEVEEVVLLLSLVVAEVVLLLSLVVAEALQG